MDRYGLPHNPEGLFKYIISLNLPMLEDEKPPMSFYADMVVFVTLWNYTNHGTLPCTHRLLAQYWPCICSRTSAHSEFELHP